MYGWRKKRWHFLFRLCVYCFNLQLYAVWVVFGCIHSYIVIFCFIVACRQVFSLEFIRKLGLLNEITMNFLFRSSYSHNSVAFVDVFEWEFIVKKTFVVKPLFFLHLGSFYVHFEWENRQRERDWEIEKEKENGPTSAMDV